MSIHPNIQPQQIISFLSKFKILEHCDQKTVISSNQNTFLIKNIQIQTENSDRTSHSQLQEQESEFSQMIDTLSQHQQFDPKHILTLVNFQVISSQNNQLFSSKKGIKSIRTVYQYGQKSLKSEIQKRSLQETFFEEEELWMLLSSLVEPLAYLESKNVIYGVLDTQRVFIDNKIKLIDPSCTGINPYQIEDHRIYSPQLLENEGQGEDEEIDMFKSDVFVLGILMLQTVLLNTNIQLGCQSCSELNELLQEVEERCSAELFEIIKSTLYENPQQRPTFTQIGAHLSRILELKTESILLSTLCTDKEDENNELKWFQENRQLQVKDILFDESKSEVEIPSELELAKLKYLSADESEVYNSEVYVSFNESLDLTNNSFILEETTVMRSQERSKSKRSQKTKQLKRKLVKPYVQEFKEEGLTNQNCPKSMNTHVQRTGDSGKQSKIPHVSFNKQNLLTDPSLMKMIRNCQQQIQQKTHSNTNSDINFNRY